MVGNPTQAACVVSALTEPTPECSQSQPRSHTGSLQIPQRARCQATPLRSVREMCLLLTSPYIEPVPRKMPWKRFREGHDFSRAVTDSFASALGLRSCLLECRFGTAE